MKAQKGIGILFLVGMLIFCLYPCVKCLPDILDDGTFRLDDESSTRLVLFLPMFFIGMSFFRQEGERRKALAVSCAIYWIFGVLALLIWTWALTPSFQRNVMKVGTNAVLGSMGKCIVEIGIFLTLFVLLLLKKQRTTVLRVAAAVILVFGILLEISERIRAGAEAEPVLLALFGAVPALAFFLSIWTISENPVEKKESTDRLD